LHTSCSASKPVDVAEQVALDKLPDYGEIASEVFVRITDLPIQDSIRDLRCGSCRQGCKLAAALAIQTRLWLPKLTVYTCAHAISEMISSHAGSIT
jgi:hypothetical protein